MILFYNVVTTFHTNFNRKSLYS